MRYAQQIEKIINERLHQKFGMSPLTEVAKTEMADFCVELLRELDSEGFYSLRLLPGPAFVKIEEPANED